MQMHNLSRRAFLGASGVALAGLGLAACGGNSSDGGSSTDSGATGTDVTGVEPQNGTPATTPLDQLPLPEKGKIYNNPQERDNVQDGGKLILPAGEVGPNWNNLSVEGNTVEMMTYWSFYMPSNLMIWSATLDKVEPNPDYIDSVEASEDSGKQVVTVKFNKDAHFNDGTPIDWRAFNAIYTVMCGENEEYTPAATDGYDQIESVAAGADDKECVITMKNPIYPVEALLGTVIHPDCADPTVFNEGWNNEPHAEWGAGPYTVDSVDDTQVTFVPNPEWWGNPAKLESVQYKQMDSQALFNAFKNGEIDATGAAASGSQEMLSNFSTMDNAEVRRANSLSVANMEINATRENVADIAVRKALMQCIDPATLRTIAFQGVNWDEENPGSLLIPSWRDGYENNLPDDVKNLGSAEERTAAAKKTLEDAGYTLNGDYYEKDGKQVTWGFTTFGDSNTSKNRAAAIQKMAKDAGMNVEIDNRPASEFSTVLTGGDWDTVIFGWSSSVTAQWNGPQIYGSESFSNFTHMGSAELDEELGKVISIADPKEQIAALNAAEKKAMESYAFVPLYCGPDVVVTKQGLANYGPALFQTVLPEDIGWQKA